MNNPERIFAVADGTFEEVTAKPAFNEDLIGKRLIIFVAGKEKKHKGFFVCPETKEDLNEFIEALKHFKITMP